MTLRRLWLALLLAMALYASSTSPAASSIEPRTQASGTWYWQNPLPQGNPLNAISCPSATVCFAAGDRGSLFATADGGTTWSQQNPGTSLNLRGINCPSTTTCLAVSDANAILKTTDGGATWTIQTAGVSPALEAVSCPSTTVCFAVSDDGYIMSTSNGAATWASTFVTGHSFLAVSCASTTMCVATGYNSIVLTTDGGATWISKGASTTEFWTGVTCPSTSVCFISGNSGDVLASTDGGNSWVTSLSGAGPLFGMSCPTTTTCYAPDLFGGVQVTTNGGASWTRQSADFPYYLSMPSCPTATICYMGGRNGTIVATTNGGAKWALQIPWQGRGMITGISCSSVLTCAATDAGDQTILTTINGGVTWTSNPASPWPMNTVNCPSVSTCYAGGQGGVILASTDGGATWRTEGYATQEIWSISCLDSYACYVAGNNGLIMSTFNGGINWTTLASGTTQNLQGISCATTSTCIAVGWNGAIVSTTNRGASWSVQTSHSTDSLMSVACPNTSTCFAGGLSGEIIGTSNGGATWTTQYPAPGPNIGGFSCTSTTTCLAVGGGNTIGPTHSVMLATTNGGANWISQDSGTTNGLFDTSCPTPTSCFAVGWGGTILANSIPSFCSSAALTSDKTSPQAGGTLVTFSAAATGNGCTNPVYEFWMWSPATGWVLRQPYGPSSHFVLDTTGMAPGTYTVDVWVEEAGSPVGSTRYETFGLEAWGVAGCDFASLAPNPAPTTGTVTFSATAGGAGCTDPQYQFWTWSPSSGWVLQQPYSRQSTWSWDVGALAGGTYSIDVWVKQAGSPLTYETWGLSTIPKGACGSNAATVITPTQSSPRPVGTTIHLATNSTCGLVPSYKYWAYPGQHGAWQDLRDYSTDGTFDWNTSGLAPGTQSLDVHVLQVRPVSQTQSPDTWGLLSYSLLGCSTATLMAGPASPQTLATPVTLTAGASMQCDKPQYQFWVYPPGGPWTMVQDYSSTSTVTWRPHERGTYAWVVYAKQNGSSNLFDSFALLADTVS